MANKLGPYIQKLMLVAIDTNQDDDVKQLAWDELKRLNIALDEFLLKNTDDMLDKIKNKKQNKQLLQEDKENVSNK